MEKVYDQLLAWCRDQDFAGHDPYDALNSRTFQATPLAGSRNARLLWTQLVKRSPIDLRTLARVPVQKNAKGIALFALAHLAIYRRSKNEAVKLQTIDFLTTLLAMKSRGLSGTAWGYNFDWQSRNFFAPRGTPTIVPTAFAARAFVEAAIAFRNQEYLATVRSVCDFILHDLPRAVETENELCFGYAPNAETRIFNASLLAAETLAGAGKVLEEPALCQEAERAARYVVNQQRADGSWTYGAEPGQSWIDNFHTAYILFSLERIMTACSLEGEFQAAWERGYGYWKMTFFLENGCPKYYHDGPYPVDTHAAASAIVTLLECRERDETAALLAQRIATWAIDNLRDEQGFFYYQRRRFYTVRKPFIRWTQAWMLYALARLREEKTD